MLSKERKAFLTNMTKKARTQTLNAIYQVGRGHVGGCMSITELLVALYYEIMNIHPNDPAWKDRDRLVVSKGHAAPIVYSVLSLKGYFESERLLTLNTNGTSLPSHCDMQKVPGIDMTAGSLGQGLSAAVGMAIANQIDQKTSYTYAIIGDGESQEGQIWEAIMLASQKKLDHLIVFIDNNKCQVDGFTKDILKMEPFDKKYEAFGWDAISVSDGHDFDLILNAVKQAQSTPGKPHAIILNTVKAKHVINAEGTYQSHCFSLTEEQLNHTLQNL